LQDPRTNVGIEEVFPGWQSPLAVVASACQDVDCALQLTRMLCTHPTVKDNVKVDSALSLCRSKDTHIAITQEILQHSHLWTQDLMHDLLADECTTPAHKRLFRKALCAQDLVKTL